MLTDCAWPTAGIETAAGPAAGKSGFSWILHPADYDVLPAAGQQDHLTVSALDEMDTATGIERDRFCAGSVFAPTAPGVAKVLDCNQSGSHADERETPVRTPITSNRFGRSLGAAGRRFDERIDLGSQIGINRRLRRFRAGGSGARRVTHLACRLFAGLEMNKSLTTAINLLFSFHRQIAVMDPTKIGLFDLAEKRLAWTAQRQSVLAANIANANTPAYSGPRYPLV